MKKLLITLTVIIAFGNIASAQNAYEDGDKIFMAGVSFGYYGYGYLGNRAIGIPPLTAALELGIHEYFSVGPYVGYASWNYNYINSGYSYNFLSLGARGSFHYLTLINDALDLDLDEEKLDFYVTIIAGVEIQSFNGDDFGGNLNYANNTKAVFGPVLGFKYKFNEKFGAYFEGGRGAFGYGTVGLAVHF